ncbi:hypothetical protein [Sinorhizobium fredii]|uniref:hypothetical protein n=1 Tax=Rhizobium fredii TaxID=380 RepID=UPI003512F89C
MPKAKRKSPVSEHTILTVRVESHEANLEAGISHDALSPEHAWDLDLDEPLYTFATQIEIRGTVIYPENRTGEAWELTIYDGRRSHYLTATLKDTHVRDERGSPQYRTYRGKHIPVLKPPKGMGIVDKVRGKRAIRSWLYVSPRFLSDALALLGQGRTLYLAAHEVKDGRDRRLRSLRLQTSDPSDE